MGITNEHIEKTVAMLDWVADIIPETVEEGISWQQLADWKHLILVRSVKQNFFFQLVDQILKINPDIRIDIIGETSDTAHIDSMNNSKIQLFTHEGRLDQADAKRYIDQIDRKDVDAVIYCTYSIYRNSYTNIVRFCWGLNKGTQAALIGWNVNQNSLAIFKDPELYLSEMNLAVALLSFGNTIASR